ncbi:MAG: ribosome-recycling factor [Nitrospirales bacterium]|nr:MAG: ribosome-recycling factor [Nitrospirales bacterium]
MAHPSLQKVTQLMEGAIEHLKREFTTLRTGRASVALLDHITVEYYGTPTPLKQVANLSVPESRLIHIQPWDPSIIKDIERALTASELGVTPSNDGKIIRLPIPPLSEERRKELVKLCKKYGEETKIQIRGFRRDGNDELKHLQKDGEISEDDLHRAEAENQKLTDTYIHKVDDLLKKKEEEILEI